MGTRLSISRLFTHFARTRPDRASLTDDMGRSVTWLELEHATNRLARAYADRGVGKDDIVAVTLPNSLEFVQACIATWKLGATVVPVSHRFPPIERHRVLDLAAPVLVVGSTDEDVPGVPQGFKPDAGLSTEPLPDEVPTYWKALTSGGSTGLPKLIFSHDEPYYDPESPEADYMHADGVNLVCGPLYHNAAFVYAFRGLFAGNELVVMRSFDPERALELIERHRVTWAQMVPTMMNRLRKLPAERLQVADVSSLRTLLHVGGPCPPPLKEEFIEWLGADAVVEVYAGTESQGITRITGAEWLQRRGSVGRAIRGSRVKILDEDGNDVPPGVVGEVFLMPKDGPGSTYHYRGAEPRSRNGWESLGDLGHLDEDGFLYLADRSTDCIVSGGANIYPAEVEGALESHPAVRACAVIGLPDDDLGHRAVAIIETDGAVTANDLDTHLRPLLAPYKRPRAYELVSTPLRDEAGKVRRSALRTARMPGGPDEGRLVMPSASRWRALRTGSAPVDALVAALDLEPADTEDVFVGVSLERPAARVFGGQVLSQAAVAAARTVPDGLVLHSLHGYFARQGDPRIPIRYVVTRLRDGRSFRLRRVEAFQGEDLICTATMSWHRPEDGLFEHQAVAPAVAHPSTLEPRFPFSSVTPDPSASSPVELRESAGPHDPDPLAAADIWMRVPAALPDDPLLHQAILIYLSDFSILRAAFRGHRVTQRDTRAASLDHALWLHRPARVDRWLHYHSSSPSAASGRALGSGALFTLDGELVASSGQEMVVRPPASLSHSSNESQEPSCPKPSSSPQPAAPRAERTRVR